MTSKPAPQRPFVVSLQDDSATDRLLTGGKGANLTRLASAGLPVPGGFVVTTDAFRAHTGVPHIQQQIEALARLDDEDSDALAEAAATLRHVIEERELPTEVREAVEEALSETGDDAAYAVRSSATAEDLPEASFAGQHETFLEVRGREALMEKIKACMASLFTDRAVAYRNRNGISHTDVALAAVVQQMAGAEAAGVLFTADPVDGNRRVAVIDAAFGLGEALVSGAVDADHARFDRRTGEVLSYETAEKEKAVRVLEGGGTETVDLPDEERRARVLSEAQVRRLARVGAKIEALFGGEPQDIEWSLSNGQLFVLQARPITALPPLPEPPPEDGALHVYLSIGHVQAMNEPMPPLVIDFWTQLMEDVYTRMMGLGVLNASWSAEAAGRVYYDLTPFLRFPTMRKLLPRWLLQLSEPAARGLEDLLARRPKAFEVHENRNGKGWVDGWWAGLKVLAGMARESASFLPRLFQSVLYFLYFFADPSADPERIEEQYDTWGQRAAAHIREAGGPVERARISFDGLRFLQQFFETCTEALGGLYAAFTAGPWLERLFPDAPEEVNAVGGGFPHEIVTRINQGLGDLADVARAHPAVREALRAGKPLEEVVAAEGGDAFRTALAEYLDTFGHRATSAMDLSRPRWREDPSGLLATVRANLAREEPGAHRAHLNELIERAEAAARRLEARTDHGPLGPIKKRFVRRLIDVYRGHIRFREHPKQGMGHIYTAWREALLDAGRHLTAEGRLARAEDVWFLRKDELFAALEDGAPVEADIAARRRRLQRQTQIDAPALLTSEGENPAARAFRPGVPDGALAGTPVSSGTVEGPARVVRDPSESTVEPGEILVAPSCDPGWTPLFLNAAGLVTEVGGRMTHGAVVAREYGLPAVVSVAGATREIRTGRRLRVDGTRGVVERIE